MTLKDFYEEVLWDAAACDNGFEFVGKPRELSMKEDAVLEFGRYPMESLMPSVGYHSRRWLDFLREYIEPDSFKRFLDKGRKPKGEVSYTFPVYARHASGNCLLGMTSNGKRLVCYSRVSSWAPVGALDLMLLNAVMDRLELSTARWHISSLRLLVNKSLPALKSFGVRSSSPFMKASRAFENDLSSDRERSEWEQRKVVNRAKRGLSRIDNEEVDLGLDEFLRYARSSKPKGPINPESIAKLKSGLRGVDIRNFLRDDIGLRWWGPAHHYLGEDCYSWDTYSDPLVQRILNHFGITLK